MKQKFSKNIVFIFLFFLLGLVFSAISILVYSNLIDFKSYKNTIKSIQNIQAKIDKNGIETKVEMMMVKTKIINAELSFSELIKISKQSLFVYHNKNLKYWNNYIFVPELSSIKNVKNEQLLVTTNGKFLVFRHDFTHKNEKYTIISLLRLTYKYPISNPYLLPTVNSDIFKNVKLSVNNYSNDNNIFNSDGTFLFSIDFTSNQGSDVSSFWFLLIGLVFWVLCFIKGINEIKSRFGFDKSVLILFIFFIGVAILSSVFSDYLLKFISLNFNILYELTSMKLKAIFYLIGISFAISILSVYIFIYKLDSDFLKVKLKTIKYPYVLLFLLGCLSCIILIILFELCKHFYSIDALSLDIREILKFKYYKILSILFFILLSFNYFICSHLVSEYIDLVLNRVSKRILIYIVVAYFFVAVFTFYIFSTNYFLIFLLNISYLSLVYKLNLVTTLKRIRYITYIYFFAGAIITCLAATLGFYISDYENIVKNSKSIANNIVKDEKIFDEKLLNEVLIEVGKDRFIFNIFQNPIFDKKLVAQKILKYYLKDIADKYDIKVYIYDVLGQNIDNNNTKNFNTIFKSINTVDYKTQFRNVYRVKGANIGYYCPLILRESNGKLVGCILLELKLRKVIPYSISPILLLEKSSALQAKNVLLSYAFYNKNTVVSTFGNFNYLKEFKNLTNDLSARLQKGIVSDGKFHIVFKLLDDKNIIISTPFDKFISTFSNFSFLFLLLSVMLAGIILINTFYYKFTQVTSTFTTKIQLFINFAFFIPLLVVSISVFYIISYSYRNDLKQTFIKKAEILSNQLMLTLTKPQNNSTTDINIADVLNESARFSQTDINLYANDGKLLASTQPKFFDYSILSSYVNPVAIADLLESFESYALIEEQIGTLTFNTIYYKIKSYNTGEMVGIVAIPFFGSDSEIQSKILEALMVIINVFTVIFILFLIASFYASRMLTKPLTMLTNKIKKTSFLTHNVPLEYKANDEIGLLVNEYNRMLLKLDESKKALSVSEKESAWREMARQVAHEIKNPLTPMKLTLQNLQRMIGIKIENIDSITNQSIEVLLEQIENLNDIASSFATYTQMPVLKIEKFDITSLLRKLIFLFESKQEVKIEHHINEENHLVLGDEKLMNRIFINLITNSLEAVADSSDPQIKLSFSTEGNNAIIKFADNGNGIDLAHRNKVFQPYFSTKNTGSGIGLAVARRGIEQMNGKIWFENLPHKGTVFIIKIPSAI